MSKRYGNVDGFSNIPKKPKLENNLEDLWGDDLDVKDVDDCFMLASQVYQRVDVQCTQRNNVSILPSYSEFKQTSKNIFTSTQSNPDLTINSSVQRSFQNFNTNTTKNVNDKLQTTFKRAQSFDYSNKDLGLESKLKQLEEQYETKIGEVSILRSKLQEVRTHNEAEHTKQQKEWNEKMAIRDKQLKSVESELEFKNLEIINLTQKLKEVTKINHVDVLKTIGSPFFKHNHLNRLIPKNSTLNEELLNSEPKIFQINETCYPLMDVIDLKTYEIPVQEMCLKDINNSFKSVNVQNQLFKLHDISIQEDCKFENIYNDLKKLKQCNLYELQLVENQVYINQLLAFSEYLVKNLLSFLQKLETSMNPIEDNYILDLESLLTPNMSHNFIERRMLQNEMGVHATQTILCIIEILPYDSIVKRCLSLTENVNENIPSLTTYLTQILLLVKLIRKLHISSNFNEFFEAVIKLLNKISLHFDIGKLHCSNIICEITREIILSVQSGCVLLCFLEYLNNIVVQNNFLVGLCRVSEVKELQIDYKKKTLRVDEHACVLHILFTIIEEFLNTKSNYLEFEGSVITFIANSIRYNRGWLFHKEDKCCACITKVVRLYVNIMYKIVKRVNLEILTSGIDEADRYCEILRSGVDALNILHFNLYDVVVKYIAIDSQYKVVIKSLLNLKNILKLNDLKVEVLENLVTTEKVPQIDEEHFGTITLWKDTFVT